MRGGEQSLVLPAQENNGNKKEEARRAVEVINASAQPGRRGEKEHRVRMLFAQCLVCSCVRMKVWIN